MKKILFIIPPYVEILDLAGPVQVFTEAREQGLETDIVFYSYATETISNSGLAFTKIADYRQADVKKGDYIFIPGMRYEYVSSIAFRAEKTFFNWLQECSKKEFLYVRSVMALLL